MKKINIFYDFCPSQGMVSYGEAVEQMEAGVELINTCCLDFFSFSTLDKGYDVTIINQNDEMIVLSELLDNDGRYSSRILRPGHHVLNLFKSGEITFQIPISSGNEGKRLIFPLDKKVVRLTSDSMSFVDVNYASETEILTGAHVGAFGTVRKNHIHEGVDLYCLPGDPVYAMEAGKVVLIEHFTGNYASPPSPWWNNTRAVHVEGKSGVIVYGEIQEFRTLEEGDTVQAGQLIGHVVTVLKKDKGRPITMLHLELYEHGSRASVTWEVGEVKPDRLQNPTPLLIAAQHYPPTTGNPKENV